LKTKVFPAKLEYLYEMLAFLKDYCNLHEAAESVVGQVILAVEEALVNIISYGYQPENEGFIDLSCGEVDQRGIKIVIKDQGIAFNPLEHTPPVLPPISRLLDNTPDTFGGYGIYILTGLMDEVDYQRLEGENILTLVKYF
jgi:serine/threonine-protein kinase RsbW